MCAHDHENVVLMEILTVRHRLVDIRHAPLSQCSFRAMTSTGNLQSWAVTQSIGEGNHISGIPGYAGRITPSRGRAGSEIVELRSVRPQVRFATIALRFLSHRQQLRAESSGDASVAPHTCRFVFPCRKQNILLGPWLTVDYTNSGRDRSSLGSFRRRRRWPSGMQSISPIPTFHISYSVLLTELSLPAITMGSFPLKTTGAT